MDLQIFSSKEVNIYMEEKYRPSLYLRKKAALETAQQQKLMDYRQAG